MTQVTLSPVPDGIGYSVRRASEKCAGGTFCGDEGDPRRRTFACV